MPSAFLNDSACDSDTYYYIYYYSIFKEKFIKYSNLFIELCGVYLLWIIIHYICSHLYVSWCTPLTLIGFIFTPFIVPSPHCQALRWAISNGGTSITAMWFSLGTWITKKLIL